MSTAGDGSINTPPVDQSFPTPSVTVVLATVLLILFFLGLFSIYFCRCFLENLMENWNVDAGRIPVFTDNGTINHNNSSGVAAANPSEEQGLDPSLVQLFPTFSYSSVKEFRREKHQLECIICLMEFQEDDLLRLLTVCYHVFHPDCIDLWLQSHKTCPVCRRDLDQVSRDSLEKTPLNIFYDDNSASVEEDDANNDNHNENHDVRLSDRSTAITIDQDSRDGDGQRDAEEETRKRRSELKKLSRSHSTGHSIVVSRSSIEEDEDDDRYTLRLMENVKVHMVSTPCRRHCAVESCIAFGELSTLRNNFNNKNNDISIISSYRSKFGEVSATSVV